MGDLTEGTVLGDRIEVVGVVGRGGTATVYLARDRHTGQRLALKVLHPHLAHDPATRDRLRREVQAAALLRHHAALVPHALLEADGLIALILPFHPGQTLTERVASGGPLPTHQVRSLGTQLADALAEAHRLGLLHRDVNPNNVLMADDGAAVLTDFGLARLAEGGAARSTRVIGTAGYAAPEVYRGARRDPRSDLYGLGATLYLAATGRPPFDAPEPMAMLQLQLAERPPRPTALRADLPPDLAALIERLLRQDPEARPQGAREVLDALELGVLPATHAPRPTAPRPHLPEGPWSVLVRERPRDIRRRQALRIARFRRVPPAERQLRRWAKQLADGLRRTLGVPGGEEAVPEDALVAEVAGAADLPVEALALAPEILERRFRLVDGVDLPTAQRIGRRARELGFDASVVERPAATQVRDARWSRAVGAGWVVVAIAAALGVDVQFLGWVLIASTVIASSRRPARPPSPQRTILAAPVAYAADLTGHLAEGFRHLARMDATAPEPVIERHGHRLARHAATQLDALEHAVADPDLPDLAVQDLRATVRALRASAHALAAEVDRIEDALADRTGTDPAWIVARLDRLETLRRAEARVDPDELARLRSALEAHRADRAAADALESQRIAGQAQLLEIASTASRVRRELTARPTHRRVEDLVARLRSETRAAEAARREAGRRTRREETR